MKLTKSMLLIATAMVASSSLPGVVILNEYNAVRADRWLDVDGAAASTATDTYFGRVEGNGGRWFELVVVGQTSTPGETIDIREWTFDWTDTDLGSGSFNLTNDVRLASIHRGTVLTFFAQDVAGPNVATNFDDYDPAGGDWWLNINVADADFVAGGSLLTGNADWQLTVKDALDATIYGPVGEGVGTLSGVSSREVGKLEAFDSLDIANTISGWQGIEPDSAFYNDGTSSTFGSGNLWSSGTLEQDFSVLQNVPEPGAYAALAGILAIVFASMRRRNKRS